MGKKKICYFCQRWASGGIESFLCNILSQMDLSELEVDIVAAQLERNDLSSKLEAMGIGFIPLSGNLHNPIENHRLFRQLLRQRQYDVVHLNLYQGLSLYYCRIARQEGVPVRIAHSHNENLRSSPTRWLKLLLHRLGRHCFTKDATQLLSCSKAAAAFLFSKKELTRRGFTSIANGIDTQHFRFNAAERQTLRREMGLEGCLVVGNVGRLCRQKNQRFLLDSFALLVSMQPNSRLLLVGDGEDRQLLQNHAAQLGIEKQVIFFGKTQQVAPLLWVMDVFALPSLFEGLSVAAVEAQAAGLPVLCAQGLSEEVKLTGQLRFLPLEERQWVNALLAMAAQNADREAAAETVRKAGFDCRRVSMQIAECYSGRNHGTS